MFAQRPLCQDLDLLLRDPVRIERAHRGPVGGGVALDLAALHREMDLGGALVAVDHLELESKERVRHHREIVLRGAGRLRADHDLRVADILEFLDRRGVPQIRDLRLAVAAAEPDELDWIKSYARWLQLRRRRQAVERRPNRRAIEGAVVVNRIRHGDAAGAGLVLHDHGRVAGNVGGEVPGDGARIDVIAEPTPTPTTMRTVLPR